MDEQRAAAGEIVIKEGEKGDELYVVEEGSLECYKKFVNFYFFLNLFIPTCMLG